MLNNVDEKKKLFVEMMIDSMDGRINKMAFSQEDLDALVENGENEIFICGEDLHIPLVEGEVYYLGVNNPTIVIDSEKIVDFDALGISIEDCFFDEKYSELLFDAGLVDNCEPEEYDDVNDAECCNEEIRQFYKSMKEYFNDYRQTLGEMTISQDFEDYFDIDEIDPADYNNEEYDYETRAKARLACKEVLAEMVSEIESELVSNVHSYIKDSQDFYDELSSSFDEFVSDLSNAYDLCASIDCGEKVEEYVMSKKREFFVERTSWGKRSAVSEDDVRKVIVKDIGNRLSVHSLAQMCDYDLYDDYYCYCIADACDKINAEIQHFLLVLEEELPQQMDLMYKTIFLKCLDVYEERFDEMFSK